MIDKQQFSCRDKALNKFSKLMVNLSSLYFYDLLAFFLSKVHNLLFKFLVHDFVDEICFGVLNFKKTR